MLEKTIERSILHWCTKQGWICLKLGGPKGFPDRSVILPDGRIVFLEVKTPNGRQSHHQKVWQKRLQKLGHLCHVVDSLNSAKKVLEDAVQPTTPSC